MSREFPDDADGDALRRFVDDGSDLSKPMTIDFQVAVPDELAASYEGIMAIQSELERLAAPLGGHPDSWGSFGTHTDGTNAAG